MGSWCCICGVTVFDGTAHRCAAPSASAALELAAIEAACTRRTVSLAAKAGKASWNSDVSPALDAENAAIDALIAHRSAAAKRNGGGA